MELWPFRRKNKNRVDIDFRAKTITTYTALSTLELFQKVELECRKKNVKNPMTRRLEEDNIVIILEAGWNFTDRMNMAYHKKDKRRFTKMTSIKRNTLTETYFSREDYKKKGK